MSKIKVIYLLPELKGASGGAKVIYNHSLLLNKINKNIDSQIIHLKKNLIYKLELSLAKRVKFFKLKLNPYFLKYIKFMVKDIAIVICNIFFCKFILSILIKIIYKFF